MFDILAVLAAREVWRGRAEPLASRNLLMVVLIIKAVLFGMRIPLGLFTPSPIGILPPGDLLIAGFCGLIIAFLIGQTVLMISVTLEGAELRQVDHAVRLGDEEFAFILFRSDIEAARVLTERIRVHFARHVVGIEGGVVTGTVSGGVFCVPDGETVRLADA